jgi:hypothetical protein
MLRRLIFLREVSLFADNVADRKRGSLKSKHGYGMGMRKQRAGKGQIKRRAKLAMFYAKHGSC